MSDKERAEFEAWCENRYVLLKKNTAGEYIPHITQLVYASWQASAARYQSRIAEVKARYEAEECVFDDQNLLADHAERYSLSMPDSHAKVVMHELAKLTIVNLSRIAELEAEVVRLQSDEDRINWLEFEAQDSMSGISAKFMKKQDAHPLKPGYRIYRYHKVHNAAPTLREAIDEAMKGGA